MKILQIFGVVAAVHAGLFLFLFAVPGCRSSGKSAAAPTPPATVDTPPAYAYEPLTPSLVESSPALDDASLNPAIAPAYQSSATPTTPGRYAPSRPGAATTTTTTAPAVAVQPAATYTVVKGDSLWGVAKKHGVTVAELAAANNLSDKAGLRIGQKLIVPGGEPDLAPTAAATASAPAVNGKSYTVMPGDTLSGIAKKNGTSVTALRAANGLSSDLLRAGQTLIVPVTAATASTTAAAAPKPAAAGSLTHTVMPGDTLGAISRKYNVSVGELATANNITDPTRMRAGQILRIPGWQTPPSTASQPAAATPAPTPAPTPSAYTPEPVEPETFVPVETLVPETVVPAPIDEAAPIVPVETSEAPRFN
ncbi:MAG: LysM peptidoglycan-binding domain-containing protein [Verrucomicrobiota bacterium]